MSKKQFMRMVLIVGSALILIGITMVGWMLANKKEPNAIEVQLADGKTQSEKFENLALIPGEACEYTIKLKKSEADQYQLKLNFVETEEKTLKNYARVKILAGDETVYDELMATAFENDGTVLSVDFAKEKNTELKIVYYLPIDIGNEAKNAEAIFELQLTASID